jgi:hypothetical protein
LPKRGNPNIKDVGFKKGDPRAGRPKGSPNKLSSDVKEAIIKSAGLSKHSKTDDLVGYTTFLADNKPEVFASLLGRLIPVQANVKHSGGVQGNTNITVNMPLGEMINNFERRIKAAAFAVQQLPRPTLVIDHAKDEDA